MDKKNNTGIENTGNMNSGDRNSGNWNSGNWNSGNMNSGNMNSGMFNTDEPKMRMFNQDSEYTYTEFREKFGYQDLELPICEWINSDDMTDDEKSVVDGWEQMGGYLKTLEFKEACKVAWEKASKQQKEWHKNLPNFNAEIFAEITGIDILEPSATITIKGKEYSEDTIHKALKRYVD